MAKRFKEDWYKLDCKKCDGEGTVENEKTGRENKCKKCNGKGKIKVYVDRCHECGGRRKVYCDCTGGLGKDKADSDCYACGGKGRHICPACKGGGYDQDCLNGKGVKEDALWEDDF